MAVQATQLYNQAYAKMMHGGESPTDAAAGTYMWVLVDAAYTPLDTHTAGTDFSGNEYGDGVGAGEPIAATNLVVTATPGDPDETFWQGGCAAGATSVIFGPTVTIDAQYLCLVKPSTPGTYATDAELIFWIDLTGNSTNLSSTAGDFTITMHASGWFKFSQA